MRISRALKDVWEWKQAVYEDIKDMDTRQRLSYFRQAARRLEEQTGRKLRLRSLGRAPRRRR